VWTHGGVGTGHFSQGYPLIEKLLDGLAVNATIIVYSHARPNRGYKSQNFIIRSPSDKIQSQTLRWLAIMAIFVGDHFKKRYDLLFAFWGYPAGVYAVITGKILRLPVIINLLGGDSVGVTSIQYGVMCKPHLRWICLWAYEQAATLTALSVYQVEWLRRYGLRKDVRVIPWGAEASSFSFQEKDWPIPLKIIHVASLNEVKDQATLLRAFQLVQMKIPATMRILGADYLGGRIQQLCHDLGLDEHVHFLGIVPYAEVPKHFEWANVIMHTSLSEGQSLALTEAASCGVLIAGTRVGLIADLGSTGAIVAAPEDFTTLANEIVDTVRDVESCRRKVAHAREWAATHDLSWTIRELSSLIDNL